jgi:RNA polymerase sigma factor (sigma-70 family)
MNRNGQPPCIDAEWNEVAGCSTAVGESRLDGLWCDHAPVFQVRLSREYAGLLATDRIEEILLIALARLWERRELFDESKGTLPGWYWRITINVARDQLRSNWCRQMLRECSIEDPSLLTRTGELLVGDERDDEEPGMSAEPGNDHELLLAVLREALERLSERRRAIVLATDRTAADLAEELGINPVTVRRHRQEALACLRTMLERELAEAAESEGDI